VSPYLGNNLRPGRKIYKRRSEPRVILRFPLCEAEDTAEDARDMGQVSRNQAGIVVEYVTQRRQTSEFHKSGIEHERVGVRRHRSHRFPQSRPIVLTHRLEGAPNVRVSGLQVLTDLRMAGVEQFSAQCGSLATVFPRLGRPNGSTLWDESGSWSAVLSIDDDVAATVTNIRAMIPVNITERNAVARRLHDD
jgi:hypothetical protein